MAGGRQDRVLLRRWKRCQAPGRGSSAPSTLKRSTTLKRRDITASGPDLAAQAITGGLVDEFHLFWAPIVVGGGKRWLPDDVRLKLELRDERRFGNDVVHLHYGT